MKMFKISYLGITAVIFLLLSACSAGGVKPQPGAIFSGPFELSRSASSASMGGGELEITITDDGMGIASATLTLSDLRCSNSSGDIDISSDGWSATTTFTQPILIEGGKFSFDLGGIDEEIPVEGEFTSPSSITAIIKISTSTEFAPPGTNLRERINCDYGTWNWMGELK